jgi:hypothetical protein
MLRSVESGLTSLSASRHLLDFTWHRLRLHRQALDLPVETPQVGQLKAPEPCTILRFSVSHTIVRNVEYVSLLSG